MSTEKLSVVRKFPSLCFEEVSRDHDLQPCDKAAVAARIDVDGHAYPVCAYHARAPMVPLSELLSLVLSVPGAGEAKP